MEDNTIMKKIYLIMIVIVIMLLSFVGCNSDKIIKPSLETKAIMTQTKEENNNKENDNSLSERNQLLYDNMSNVEMRDFSLPDFDGVNHLLSDYKGSIIVLNFWAIGCPPCVDELPDFDRACAKDGVQLITVAQKNVLGNNKSDSGEFISSFNSIALWDEEVKTMNEYPSQYYPHTYIIDRQGIVRFAINSIDYEGLDELISFCDEILD